MDEEVMKTQKNKKILYISIAAITVIVLVAIVLICVLKGDKTYRMIKVVNTENTSMVNRKGAGEFEAFEGLFLENGDHVDTLSDGRLFLDLDEDKHISVEPNTVFDIELAGNEDLSDARTKINLLEGSITNVIEKTLMENETYEVETPTGTMAVRGTEFLTTAGMLGGEKYAEVQVTKGKVEIYRPNDIKAGTVTVEAGKMLVVKESDELLSELVPWNIGEQPVQSGTENAENNEEDELPYYEFAFSFEDFKFDGKTISADTFTDIMNNYNVNRPITAGAGEAFSTEDGNINVTYSTDNPSKRYITWKTTGEYWETVAIADYEYNNISYRCDSSFQEAELRSHFSSPIKEGMSKESIMESLNIPEDALINGFFQCNLSDKGWRAAWSEESGYILLYENSNESMGLDIHIVDGVVSGWVLRFPFK